jgi:hypothetical protein
VNELELVVLEDGLETNTFRSEDCCFNFPPPGRCAKFSIQAEQRIGIWEVKTGELVADLSVTKSAGDPNRCPSIANCPSLGFPCIVGSRVTTEDVIDALEPYVFPTSESEIL